MLFDFFPTLDHDCEINILLLRQESDNEINQQLTPTFDFVDNFYLIFLIKCYNFL